MTPANERKAKERKAKREAGLVRVEVWVPKGREEDAKAAVVRAMALADMAEADAPLIASLPNDTARA